MKPLTVFGPDFPFAYDDWIKHPAGLGTLPKDAMGAKIGIIGSGAAGIIAGYELMKLGAHPIIFESGQFGGRLRSQSFEGADNVIAELGACDFLSRARDFITTSTSSA